MNFSSFEECKVASLDSEVYHPALILLQIVCYVILETVGNCALGAVIIFEKYGMDSQKRTVTNQLLSSILVALIVFNVLFISTVLFLKIFGAGQWFCISGWYLIHRMIKIIYKRYRNLHQSSPDSWHDRIPDFFHDGPGRNYGFEAFVHYTFL